MKDYNKVHIYEDVGLILQHKGYVSLTGYVWEEAQRIYHKLGMWERITDDELEWVDLVLNRIRSLPMV